MATEALALIVWCKQNAGAPPDAIGVEVSRDDHDGVAGPTFFARPGPDAPAIMFRLTSVTECPGVGAGFKLYGAGRWAAAHAGDEDCGTGRAEAFAVTPAVAADVLNALFRFGWMLSTCPAHLAGIHERAWNPKYPDDIRPLSAWVIEAECGYAALPVTPPAPPANDGG